MINNQICFKIFLIAFHHVVFSLLAIIKHTARIRVEYKETKLFDIIQEPTYSEESITGARIFKVQENDM